MDTAKMHIYGSLVSTFCNSIGLHIQLDGILQQKDIALVNHAYYKHVGAYSVLKQVGENMRTELRSKGLEPGLPYIEIYGHWTKDESKCETELLMCLV